MASAAPVDAPTPPGRRRAYAPKKQEIQPFYAYANATLLSEADPNPKPAKVSRKEEADWQGLYNHLEARRQALWTWRLPWWSVWGQIAQFIRPERYTYFVTANVYEKGRRKDQAIVDRTATICSSKCGAGIMAGLTDPDRKWLSLGPAIPGFELDQDGQQWYEDLTERLNYIYTHSNFYDAQAQHDQDLVDFGTAVIIDYPDEEEIIHCVTPCAGEYMLGANFDFSDETLYREFRLTISQIVEMFGIDNCPSDIQQMWKQKGGALEYEQVIGHAIEPNFAIDDGMDRSVGVVPGGFTWREVYWIRGKKDAKPLSMTGFHEQPFAVSRWDTQANDPYGHGPGEYALGDTIQLQLETRQKAESIEKVNRPPMGADVALMNQPSSTNPGKITYMNTANGEKKFFPLYEIKPDIPAITADIALIQERIARTFYNDVFQPMEDLRNETQTSITATEIDAIKEERLLPLGPVFGRAYGALRSRVRRHIAIMIRRGLVPPKPASLQGIPTLVQFESMLTKAQKATSTAAIARTVQYAGSISDAFPEAKYVINGAQSVRSFADGVGATTKILNSPAQAKKLMLADQQKQQAMMAAQAAPPAVDAAKSLSQTSLAPGTALSALVGGQGQ